jgi:polyhydroxyalkanoate synthesis regulator phasin
MADGKQGTQQEAWRAYLELAMGVTEASKKKAQKVAKRLAGRGGATAQQLQTFADNLVSTSLANREALTKLVRSEVDRALGAVGLAKAEEVTELNDRVRDLERQLSQARSPGATPARGVAKATGTAAVKRAPAKKVAAKTAKTAVAKKAVAKKTVARKAPAKKTSSLATGAGTPGTAPSEGAAKKVTGKAAVAKKVAPPSGLAPE